MTNPDDYSPLALAYIGDSVYDLIIKMMVFKRGNRPVGIMHKETSELVRASSQSLMMRAIQKELTTKEHAVYNRGRNCRGVTPARNQTVTDYRRATGFEALIGYLYLRKEWNRLLTLIKVGLDSLEADKGETGNESDGDRGA